MDSRRKITTAVIILIGGYLIITLSRSIYDLWQRSGDVEKAKAKLNEAQIENQKLKAQLSYVKTDAFVEKEAREKLNLVKPDETAVLIPQEMLQEASKAALPTPTPLPNYEQWIKLFF